MEENMELFEDIYASVTGCATAEAKVPWVDSIFVEGTVYSDAYQELWDARLRLGQRFGVEFTDEDLETIMGAICDIEREIARYMFHYGMEYAKRESR